MISGGEPVRAGEECLQNNLEEFQSELLYEVLKMSLDEFQEEYQENSQVKLPE